MTTISKPTTPTAIAPDSAVVLRIAALSIDLGPYRGQLTTSLRPTTSVANLFMPPA